MDGVGIALKPVPGIQELSGEKSKCTLPIHALHEIILKIHQLTYDFDILMLFLTQFA